MCVDQEARSWKLKSEFIKGAHLWTKRKLNKSVCLLWFTDYTLQDCFVT